MEQLKYLILIILLNYSFTCRSQQSHSILDRFIISLEVHNWDNFTESMTDVRKIRFLNSIQLSNNLLEYDENMEDFFPLDTSGLYFLDLNFDGNVDLVYNGMISYTQYSTKIYLQEEKIFSLTDEYLGITKHIKYLPNEGKIKIFVHEPPCCDSYTHSLMKYELTKDGKMKLKERILFLDPNGRQFRGFPMFNSDNTGILKRNCILYLKRDEFKGHAWFGSRKKTNEITAKLRDQNIDFITIADISHGTKVYLLDHVIIDGNKWHFILTDQIGSLDNSLFERWQVKSYKINQYLGWIKDECVNK